MSNRPLRSRPWLWAMAGLGALGTGTAFLIESRQRFWANFIVWFLFVLTIGLGALFTVALNRLVGARWSVPLARGPERIASLVVPGALLGLLSLFALPVLYPWTRPEAIHHPVLAAKTAWLNVPFFVTRVGVCAVLWLGFLAFFLWSSLRQDRTRDPVHSVRAKRMAPVFMVVFAFSITLVGFDWISSLEPEWYSDIFGVYVFVGTFLSGLAASTLAVLHLRAKNRLPGVAFDHLYNLGGLMFAFTVFWAYIGFAQYMLIWYANLPEEVVWYQRRLAGSWGPVAVALAVMHFGVPFFMLLTREAKGHPRVLAATAVVMLCAHWLDLYWMVFPTLGTGVVLGWPELAFALLFMGAGLEWVNRWMQWGNDVPEGDPLLAEGLRVRI